MEKRRILWVAGAALAVVVAAFWWFSRPSAEPAAPAQESAAVSRKTGLIALNPAQLREMNLQWAVARAADAAPLAELPGTVEPPPNARVAVTALFPGVIERIFVMEGERVRRGQPLAVVRSTEVLTLHADLVRAQARLGAARSSAARLSQLSREGVIAGARADEARASLREAEADASEKRRLLAMAGAAGSSGTFTLTAPIAGRVTDMTVKTGDRLDTAAAPFVVDAAGLYQVTAQLPERLAGSVHPGMRVRVAGQEGKVTAVGTTIDPATRSVLLKANLPQGATMLAGGAVSVTVLGPPPAGAVVVPASAIVTLNGTPTAFVRTAEGVVVRTVRTEGAGGEQVLVLAGLRPGESVVVQGTSELKALALAE